MDENRTRQSYLDMLATVRAKLDALPANGHIRYVLTSQKLGDIEERIKKEPIARLAVATWPAL